MSSSLPKKIKVNQQEKQKKQKEVQQNEVLMNQTLLNIDYPQHLHEVNYFAMDTFEACVEDQFTNKIYHEAIMQNQNQFAGKIVLHLTEGINFLHSFFAAQAGSTKVYCVIVGDKPQRDVQNKYMIKKIVEENKLQDCIQVFLWKDFNTKVDIIIGQPMGYCLHFDGLLDKIILARDKFLNRKGILIPNALSFKCGVVHDEHFSDYKVNYWNDVYGIPMTSMKKWISHEPVIKVVDPNLIVSKVTKLLTFNLETVTYDEIVKIDRVFEADLLGPCMANGIAFWFEIFFDHGIEKKSIKASPWVENTRYTQVTLYWPDVVQFNGGKLRIRLKGQKLTKQGYSVITTEVNSQIYQYSFS